MGYWTNNVYILNIDTAEKSAGLDACYAIRNSNAFDFITEIKRIAFYFLCRIIAEIAFESWQNRHISDYRFVNNDYGYFTFNNGVNIKLACIFGRFLWFGGIFYQYKNIVVSPPCYAAYC